MKTLQKKGVMNEVVSVAVMVLVISVLFGLTFLFTAELKGQTLTTSQETVTVTDEAGWINTTGYTLDGASATMFSDLAITEIVNATAGDGTVLTSGNWTITDAGVITNATAVVYPSVNISYTYVYVPNPTSYNSVNDTEASGATVIDYLPLIFLSLIFGAILMLVLKVILPYVNLGRQMQGF